VHNGAAAHEQAVASEGNDLGSADVGGVLGRPFPGQGLGKVARYF
jgi:hypothetical protein